MTTPADHNPAAHIRTGEITRLTTIRNLAWNVTQAAMTRLNHDPTDDEARTNLRNGTFALLRATDLLATLHATTPHPPPGSTP